jgi:hypothetical protein
VRCSKETKGFEETVMRRMFGPYRIRVNMPTRHPEQRPDVLPLTVVRRDDTVEVIKIAADKHPAAIAFPIYPEPGILIGRDPKERVEVGVHGIITEPVDVTTLTSELDSKGIRLGLVDPNAFARLLAKTAFALCFAEYRGLPEGFRPLCLDLITGKPGAVPMHVVGCAPGGIPDPQPGVPHTLMIRDVETNGKHYLFVDIRLFAFLRTPVYRIVVAERALVTTAVSSSEGVT